MKSTGSLALRVFLVCVVLLVVPLLIHTFILYRQEYRSKVHELFLQLMRFSQEKEQQIKEFLAWKEEDLKLISLGLEGKTNVAAHQFLDACKEAIQADTLTLSASSTMGAQPFLTYDPQTKMSQIFLTQQTAEGQLLLGVDVEAFLKQLSQIETTAYPFYLALMDEQKKIVGSPFHKGEELKIYSSNEIENALFHVVQEEMVALEIPFPNTRFSLIITVPKSDILPAMQRQLIFHLFSLFFLALLIGALGAFWLTRRMARPLTSLRQTMQKVAQGDLSARFTRDRMGFEINVLGKSFNQMIDALSQSMQEAKGERLQRELLANEFKIGHDIQKSIFPREMPEIPKVDIAAGFLAAREVAGDFYDLYYKPQQNQLMFAIADAAGKGISACIYSLSVRSMLRSFTASHEDFAHVIRLTNQLFCQDAADSGAFVTAWIGNLDLSSKRLQYCSCGHPPVLLKRKNAKIEELTTTNPAFGVLAFDDVHLASVELFPGDLLLLYTDGLIEAHDQKMQLFGKKRLYEIVDTARDVTAKEMVDLLMKKVADFEKGSPQFDDLTLLVIKIL
jgi:serine phosphatase RsbU (regulator of sigma subunit)